MYKKLAILSLLILSSCGGKETNDKNSKNDTPEALQEGSIDLKRYSKRNDLAEELYQELATKNPELKSLETDLEEFSPEETQQIFYKYDSKSSDYYLSAKYKAAIIADTVMKNKIIALLKKSNDKYVGKTAELNGLLKTIGKTNSSINDYHNVLKIVLTIPLIEKYQNENLPKNSEFEKTINYENKLIERTKKLTPKF